MCVFGILIVFLPNFAFEPGREESLRLLPGLLWISFAIAGVLCFNRSFAVEREHACLEGMALAPAAPGLIYLGKMFANLFFLGVAECVIVFAVGLWYNLSFVRSLGWLALITFLCTVAYVAVGTTFGAIATHLHLRKVMLPVLQFPVALPVLIAGIEASTGALKGDPLSSYAGWLGLAGGLAVIFIVLSYLLFEYVLKE
jgi:heme exporter protein B